MIKPTTLAAVAPIGALTAAKSFEWVLEAEPLESPDLEELLVLLPLAVADEAEPVPVEAVNDIS